MAADQGPYGNCPNDSMFYEQQEFCNYKWQWLQGLGGGAPVPQFCHPGRTLHLRSVPARNGPGGGGTSSGMDNLHSGQACLQQPRGYRDQWWVEPLIGS